MFIKEKQKNSKREEQQSPKPHENSLRKTLNTPIKHYSEHFSDMQLDSCIVEKISS